MNRSDRRLIAFAGVILLAALAPLVNAAGDDKASSNLTIGAPGLPPSSVDANGDLHEDWGVIGLRIDQPQGTPVTGQTLQMSPTEGIARCVTTSIAVDPIAVTSTVYRAPIWPAGVDVLLARVENRSDSEVQTRLRVTLPQEVSLGERVAVAGGRAVLALPKEPQPTRRERSWGAVGGDVPMPGWGRPEGECDPAFRNIRAGMGGVPIIYRFAVAPGAKRTVVLGFCESHHSQAGQRPLVIYVEGAPKAEIDPIAAWGRHQPGCLRLDASDVNGDGRLQVVVAPAPGAPDRNPILNVIWIFSPDVYVDTAEVRRGKMSSVAEHYVDVGGEKDQSLYEGGALIYDLTLPARASSEFMFLAACPGASAPNAETTAWTPESLRQAADDVWSDWAGREARAARAR